jgi:protein SCO1/2
VNARLQIALVLLAIFSLGAVIVVASTEGDGDATPSEVFEGARLPPELPAPLFARTNQDGEPVRMSELLGSPVIVTFLYTNCDNTCPLQAQIVKGTLSELDEDVPALAIAVDPARDTPESARRFLTDQRMTGRLDFVLGTRKELEAIWTGYAIQPQSVREEHTGRFVLVDKDGYQRVGFPLGQATPERLAHDVRILLAE